MAKNRCRRCGLLRKPLDKGGLAVPARSGKVGKTRRSDGITGAAKAKRRHRCFKHQSGDSVGVFDCIAQHHRATDGPATQHDFLARQPFDRIDQAGDVVDEIIHAARRVDRFGFGVAKAAQIRRDAAVGRGSFRSRSAKTRWSRCCRGQTAQAGRCRRYQRHLIWRRGVTTCRDTMLMAKNHTLSLYRATRRLAPWADVR